MTLKVYRPGIAQYADGKAYIKMLLSGGPDAGKTRGSSFFPKPFYAMAEPGAASLVGRPVLASDIASPADMDEALRLARLEAAKPDGAILTFVLDTIDAWQNKLIVRRLGPGKDAMSGPDGDWGWLETQVNRLMDQLMSLPCNVVVLMHTKEKRQDDKSVVNEPLLKGDIRNQIFNAFDLCGNLEIEYEAVNGKRVLKRTLSFQTSPQFPWLKDRFHVMPPSIRVNLDDDADPDMYSTLYARVLSKMDSIPETETTIVDLPGEARPANVDGPQEGGAVASTVPPKKDPPAPRKTRAQIQAELKAQSAAAQGDSPAAPDPAAEVPAASPEPPAADASAPEPETPATDGQAAAPEPPAEPEPTAAEVVSEPAAEVAPAVQTPVEDETAASQEATSTPAPPDVEQPPAAESTQDEAIAAVQEAVPGTTVVSDDRKMCGDPGGVTRPSEHITGCGKELDGDYMKGTISRVARVKYGRWLCEQCNEQAKAA